MKYRIIGLIIGLIIHIMVLLPTDLDHIFNYSSNFFELWYTIGSTILGFILFLSVCFYIGLFMDKKRKEK